MKGDFSFFKGKIVKTTLLTACDCFSLQDHHFSSLFTLPSTLTLGSFLTWRCLWQSLRCFYTSSNPRTQSVAGVGHQTLIQGEREIEELLLTRVPLQQHCCIRRHPEFSRKYVPEMWTDITDYAEIKSNVRKILSNGRKQVIFLVLVIDAKKSPVTSAQFWL